METARGARALRLVLDGPVPREYLYQQLAVVADVLREIERIQHDMTRPR